MSRFAATMLAIVMAGGILTTVDACTSATAGIGSANGGPTASTGTGSANGGPTSTQTADGVARAYPLHTNVVATTFWAGEIFDPKASDGSQVISTYDSQWLAHYGGCDGIVVNGDCQTEVRSAANAPTAS